MTRKFFETMKKAIMTIATAAFVGMITMCINDVLYEYVAGWYGERWQALLIGVVGYAVISYQMRIKKEEAMAYWMLISPRIDRVITAVNNACESDKKEEDKVA